MDLTFVDGNVISMAFPCKREEAIAVKDGRIAAVGSSRAISGLQTPETRLIDLQGKTVLAGFIDSHAHGYLIGIAA